MKVAALIKTLQMCDQEADVEFAYASDSTTAGIEISGVVQIMYVGEEENDTFCTVQIRAV